MIIGTRHCIEYNYGGLPGLELPERGDDSWFQVRLREGQGAGGSGWERDRGQRLGEGQGAGAGRGTGGSGWERDRGQRLGEGVAPKERLDGACRAAACVYPRVFVYPFPAGQWTLRDCRCPPRGGARAWLAAALLLARLQCHPPVRSPSSSD